jgi:DNA repair exonuclease SbcCD ATPase subunit
MADEKTDVDVNEEELNLETEQEIEQEQDEVKAKRGRPSKADTEAAELKEELERLRKYHHKANKEAEKFRHELKAYRELGVEPETIQGLLKEREEAELKAAEARQDWESLREKMKENQHKELSKKDQEVETMRQELAAMQQSIEEHLVDAQLTSEIASQGVKPRLLMPHIRNKVKAVKNDAGKYGVAVLDDDGNIRENFTIKDLLEEAKNDEDLSGLFPAPESSGAATTSAGQSVSKDIGDKALLKKRKSELTQAEKERIIDKFGGIEYAKMKY